METTMERDVILVVVNGQEFVTSVDSYETLADVRRDAWRFANYENPNPGDWEIRAPDGDVLPATMPVRELAVAGDSRPDLFILLRAGVAA
jgi:hypothetical protein